MCKIVVAVALLAASLSGCLGESPGMQEPKELMPTTEGEGTASTNATEIVDYYSWARFGTDLVGRDYVGLCDREVPEPLGGRFYEKVELMRLHGHIITDNHTMLEFQYQVDDLFAETEISGLRIGAYYNHTLIHWSEAFKENARFTLELHGMYDIDKDYRWTFFSKWTDPTTEDDEDACTSGFTSGSHTIKITAVR